MTKRNLGFTLIEMLVVIAIFSTTTLIALDLFFTVNRVERKSVSTQRITADARFALETIARDARNGSIDYVEYGKQILALPATISWSDIGVAPSLVLRDQDDVQVCYRKNNDVLEVTNTCSGGPWQAITPTGVKVLQFDVYITPASDPYLRPRPISAQPTRSDDCRLPGNNLNDLNGTCICADRNPNDCWAGQTCNGPTTGPGVCTNPSRQPMVTIVLVTQGSGPSAEEQGIQYLQTTVTSRRYQR